MHVKDRIVVVTGGGSGIGEALCKRFHKEGAKKIIVVDQDEERANNVASLVGGDAHRVNVREERAIADAVLDIENKYGTIDLFCSNAGILGGDGEQGWATGANNATWQAMWEIHVMSHVWAARACLPGMISRGKGYFLNTASAAGILNQVGDAAYSTTKHAAVGFAEALAITHGDDGIGVSCLCPQAVATRMLEGLDSAGTAGVDGILTADQVAVVVVEALGEDRFLILPHPQVADYRTKKTENYDRWIGGMRKLRRRFIPS